MVQFRAYQNVSNFDGAVQEVPKCPELLWYSLESTKMPRTFMVQFSMYQNVPFFFGGMILIMVGALFYVSPQNTAFYGKIMRAFKIR